MRKKQRLADWGLNSERVLWRGKGPGVFEQELGDLEDKLMLTTVEKALRWAQGNSIWPDTFGLACCAMEMIAIVSSRYDVARFGAEVFRSSPRQADLLIVSGRVAHKMAAPLRQIYDQMLEPKWVIAMGACASSGGMFSNYAIPIRSYASRSCQSAVGQTDTTLAMLSPSSSQTWTRTVGAPARIAPRW